MATVRPVKAWSGTVGAAELPDAARSCEPRNRLLSLTSSADGSRVLTAPGDFAAAEGRIARVACPTYVCSAALRAADWAFGSGIFEDYPGISAWKTLERRPCDDLMKKLKIRG